MLNIVKVPNPILASRVKKVDKFDQDLTKMVDEMIETLNAQVNPQGVGLAAPQVGVNLALFIIKPSSKAKTEAFVNPRILKFEVGSLKLEDEITNEETHQTSNVKPKTKKKKRNKLEGCLSIPKIWGGVSRAAKVLIEYQDLNGKSHKKWFRGFRAVIIQHEVDHLYGILFTQRALEQNTQLYEEQEGKLKKLKY